MECQNKCKFSLSRHNPDLIVLTEGPEEEAEFLEKFSTNLEDSYARYKAVIHLHSPSMEHGYNHQNPVRVETAEEAGKIDAKIHKIWNAHPCYHEVQSSDSFLVKVNQAVSLIERYIPECCRGHFK